MADSPVQVYENKGERQGQPQAQPQDVHDGVHVVHEVATVTDRVILDPNADNAVQVPEGVGATTAGHFSPLGEALKAGTPEAQFASAEERDEPEGEPEVESSDAGEDEE